MNTAAYRIDVQNTPNDPYDWYASATRLSDDNHVMGSGQYGETREEAILKVREWIAAESTKQEGCAVYVDDAGEITESPIDLIDAYSVRAS